MFHVQLPYHYYVFYTQKLYSDHTIHIIHYQDHIKIQIQDIIMDGLEVSSKLLNQLEDMILLHMTAEINFVKIISE